MHRLYTAPRCARRPDTGSRVCPVGESGGPLVGSDASPPLDLVETLRFDAAGLVPVVLQDHVSREVLILAYMDRDALSRTLGTGLVHFYSRSRGEIWLKGESSGRLQHVVEVRPNCELDSLLVLVRQELPGACHTGHSSCYYQRLADGGLEEVAPPLFDPDDVYEDASSEYASLLQPLAELLGAYRWLAEREIVPESRTWRILHGEGPDPLERLRDEWGELLGVLDGTHVHEGFERDALLEAYQVLYWTCLLHVRSVSPIDPPLAAHSLLLGWRVGQEPRRMLEAALAQHAEPAHGLPFLWEALGAACREAGLDPELVVRRDLEDLRERPYMGAYFAGAQGS